MCLKSLFCYCILCLHSLRGNGSTTVNGVLGTSMEIREDIDEVLGLSLTVGGSSCDSAVV